MWDVRLIARPLKQWPGKLRASDERTHSPFSATWTQTVKLLNREAGMLGAAEVVLQLAVGERDIRNDGWIRADAKPIHPGVTLVLPESEQGNLSFSTDRYEQFYGYSDRMPGWQSNVRALALSMEALRAADRHGVMQGRQYAGFKELGSGIALDAFGSAEEAAVFILSLSDIPDEHAAGEVQSVVGNAKVRGEVYRRAARAAHPDAGGAPGKFQQLQAAKAFLDRLDKEA